MSPDSLQDNLAEDQAREMFKAISELIAEIDRINCVLYATNKQEELPDIDLLTTGDEPFQARHSY